MSRSTRTRPGSAKSAPKAASRASTGGAKATPAARSTSAPAFAIPGVQRKMAVGKSDSPFEREADSVADSVLSGTSAPAITPLPAAGLGAHAQRKESGEETKEKEEEEAAQAMGEEEEEEAAQMKAEEEAEEEEPAQAQAEEEEEELQTKSEAGASEEEETEEMAQAKKEEEEEPEAEPAQTKAENAEEEAEEEEPAQAKSSNASQERDRTATTEAMRNPGSGREIPGEVRRPIERSTGADLGDVRVHDDGRAARAAQGIGARAFTHGRNIWLGAGESARDTRLMAHEAAHVVQQTGPRSPAGRGASGGPSQAVASGAQGAPVQRNTEDESVGPPVVTTRGHTVDFSGSQKKLEIARISLPNKPGKSDVAGPFIASKPGTRDDDPQRDWLDNIEISSSDVTEALPESKGFRTTENPTDDQLIFILKVKNQQSYVVGTRADVAAQTKIPNWRKNGQNDYMQVDHKKEKQVGGTDTMDNYQLLDSRTNLNSGDRLRQQIRQRINTAKGQLKTKAERDGTLSASQLAELDKSADQIRADFDEVRFAAQTSTHIAAPGPKAYWTESQIENAEHIKSLDLKDATSLSQAEQDRFLGSENKLTIYIGKGASSPRNIDWGGNSGPVNGGQTRWIGEHFDLVDVGPHGNAPNQLIANVYKRHDKFNERQITVPLTPIGGRNYAFRMPADLRYSEALSFSGWSPVSIHNFAIEETGMVLRGALTPTVPVFKGDTTIDLLAEDGDITLSKTFSGDEFDFPGPVKVTGSSLTLGAGAGSGGFSVSITGELNFEVDRVGKGVLRGEGSTSGGFAVNGEFDFDPALFKGADAKITVGYADDTFTGSGTLKIGDEQIKGIKSAELNVTVTDDVWEANGSVEPKIPGVSQGTLAMKFDPNGGFMIAGELTLGAGIPRLKSGKLDAKLEKTGEAYKVSASGNADLDIPGVAASLTASYDDGKFKAEATVGYARGIASGRVTVGATNMPVDPETGQFTDGAPTESVTIYGTGSVTIRFTPWLQGTAGLKIKPDGSMEVKGKVELPDTVEVFPEKKLEKELVSVSADLPIVGVAVAGQRIGIFLNITGGLTAKASIGPGELKDVAVEVTYNPEDESSARVTGSARFEVPAEAGLRLTIQGALGAGIPVVSARAGLELGAELGIKALASADAEVEWTPSSGINMEANVGISASPQFTFDISGFADVTADLILDEIELYSKRWKLASFTYGSGMAVGANLKVKVENNEFKPITMDDVELTTPDIDPMALVRGVARQVF